PGYQAGSTFKLFTMLAALEKGMPLSTEISSPQRYQSKWKTEWNSPTRCNGLWWCPVNASAKMTGRHTMWAGFGKSVNTFFVQLEERVGPEAAVRMAERLGLQWHTDIDRLQASPAKARTWGAFTLGVADTSPLEMAGACGAPPGAPWRWPAPTRRSPPTGSTAHRFRSRRSRLRAGSRSTVTESRWRPGRAAPRGSPPRTTERSGSSVSRRR